MAELVVDFAALDAAESDLRSTAERLRSLTAELTAGLRPVTEAWTGAAAQAYAQRQQQWDTAARDLVAVLDELRTRLATVRANHHAAVGANRAIWTP